MNTSTQHPRVFVSYSWTNTEHEQFVINLSTALRNHGVDAILDKWDLKPGQDKFVFMESMVTDVSVSRVLVICDKKYQEKANARAGGVGTESQIISQEVYGKVNQTKFIPVVCEYDDDGQPCLPVFMKGLIYVDASTDERYGDGLDEILRLIYEQPLHQKPRLGTAPIYTVNVGTSYAKELAATVRAIRESKPNRQGLEALFLKSLIGELENRYAEPVGQDYHEQIYHEIVASKGLRDRLSDYCEAVAAFSGDEPSSIAPFNKLMDGIASQFGPPDKNGSYYAGWKDVYLFFALEALLIQVAALIRHARWKTLGRLIAATYIVRSAQGQIKGETCFVFNASLVAVDEHRNHKLNLQRTSLSADLLKERCSPDKTSFLEISEADVFLTLAAVARLGGGSFGNQRPIWKPRTTVYHDYSTKFPLFIRASDEVTRDGIHRALAVEDGAVLKSRIAEAEKIMNGFGWLGYGHFSDFDFLESINFNELVR